MRPLGDPILLGLVLPYDPKTVHARIRESCFQARSPFYTVGDVEFNELLIKSIPPPPFGPAVGLQSANSYGPTANTYAFHTIDCESLYTRQLPTREFCCRPFLEPNRPCPHDGVRPFHQKSTCITQLTFGLFRNRNWFQLGSEFPPDETLVAHRVDTRILSSVKDSWSTGVPLLQETVDIRNRAFLGSPVS